MVCTYLSSSDIETFIKVSDKEVQDFFDLALEYEPNYRIQEVITPKRWFKKERVDYYLYNIFIFNGKPSGEAQELWAASGDKRKVLAYLIGFINGYEKRDKKGQ